MIDTPFVLDIAEIALKDVASVGGKNASLGEMFRALRPKGVCVLDGFATTAPRTACATNSRSRLKGTELLVALVMRTRRPFFRSRPGPVLLASTMALIPIALAILYVPFADVFGFVPLRGTLVSMIGLIAVLYVTATEVQKKWFHVALNDHFFPRRTSLEQFSFD
jgi:hypothetical protein